MADNSPAISAAAREVFPTATRRNCKVHVIRAVDKKFESLGIDKATADPTDVKEFQEIVAVVARSTLYDDEYTCNCPIGTLRKHCKHVLVVECLNGNREWPNITLLRHTIQQAERNGRVGRPRNHTRAVVVD